jgi:hypothetical protein
MLSKESERNGVCAVKHRALHQAQVLKELVKMMTRQENI